MISCLDMRILEEPSYNKRPLSRRQKYTWTSPRWSCSKPSTFPLNTFYNNDALTATMATVQGPSRWPLPPMSSASSLWYGGSGRARYHPRDHFLQLLRPPVLRCTICSKREGSFKRLALVLRRQSLFSSAYIDSQQRTHACTTSSFYSVTSAPHSFAVKFKLRQLYQTSNLVGAEQNMLDPYNRGESMV